MTGQNFKNLNTVVGDREGLETIGDFIGTGRIYASILQVSRLAMGSKNQSEATLAAAHVLKTAADLWGMETIKTDLEFFIEKGIERLALNDAMVAGKMEIENILFAAADVNLSPSLSKRFL